MGERFYLAQIAYHKVLNKALRAAGLKKDILEKVLELDPSISKKDLSKQLKPQLLDTLTTLEEIIMAWTQEQKDEVIAAYKEAGPTAENSTEIIKTLAEEYEQSPNGVRMILVQAGVYVKKEAAGSPAKTTTGGDDKVKRVSKESQLAALRAAITDAGGTVDDEVLEKLTGKAAAYFAGVITSITK